MIKIDKNNVIKLPKVKLSNKQIHTLNTLDDRTKLIYIQNFLGLLPKQIDSISRNRSIIRDKQDVLSEKRKNTMIYIANKRNNNDAHTNHKPLHKNANSQWVGVEIECIFDEYVNSGEPCGDCDDCYEGDVCHNTSDSPEDSSFAENIRQELNDIGVKNCSVRGDSSINDFGLEFCLLFDASRGFDQLRLLCEVLNNNAATVDSTCGLHIHLDCAKLNKSHSRDVGYKLHNVLPVLNMFLNKDRVNTSYCKTELNEEQRYSAINFTSYSKHKTIEVRSHSGTTNFKKITNWIKLLNKIKDSDITSSKISDIDSCSKIQTVQELYKKLDLPLHLIKYFNSRYNLFNDNKLDLSGKVIIELKQYEDAIYNINQTIEAIAA